MMHTPSASDKPEPTPRPWHINGYDSENGTPAFISGKGGEPILSIHRTNPDAEANAYHILRCVNAHESLVQALEFYANHDNWKEQETGIGMFPGEALDYGATARQALATLSERNVER